MNLIISMLRPVSTVPCVSDYFHLPIVSGRFVGHVPQCTKFPVLSRNVLLDRSNSGGTKVDNHGKAYYDFSLKASLKENPQYREFLRKISKSPAQGSQTGEL